MKMLGHDYVTDYHEAILLPRLFQDFQKAVAAARASQIPAARMTATGDEVEISSAVVTVKAIGQLRTLLQKLGAKEYPRRKNLLRVLEWGKSRDRGPPFRKKRERVGHPRFWHLSLVKGAPPASSFPDSIIPSTEGQVFAFFET